MSCDRISGLPDNLLNDILSYLPTKESVRTSVLSKRWKLLWSRVPVLDLLFSDDPRSEASDIFVDKFLDNHKRSGTHIQKLKIMFEHDDFSEHGFKDWISTTVDRGVQHLKVDCSESLWLIRDMPKNIFKSNRLVSLTLVAVGIETPEFIVSLPCLKVMHLKDIRCDDSLIMEKLLSGSPLLEDLRLAKSLYHIVQDVLLVLRVRSQSLKRFWFWCDCYNYGKDFSVEIDAPQLEYLCFKDNLSDMIVVKNLNSLSVVDIHSRFKVEYGSALDPGDLRRRDVIHDFLSGISNARNMLISEQTVAVLYLYSELGQIPKFDNLHRLEAVFSISMLKFLPIFLESSPNLKNLILEISVLTEAEQVELNNVPVCLSSTLECVEIKELIMMEETGIKLVNYFLENSAVLKKLSVHFNGFLVTNQEERDAYKNLLTSTKLSRRCQVVFHSYVTQGPFDLAFPVKYIIL